MLIEAYFQEIEQAVTQSPIVIDSRISTDKRSLYIGFVEGEVAFMDGSKLHFMEFVNVKIAVNRYKYSFHYQDATGGLVFRYDMAPHHREISTFPHHKHLADGRVVEAMLPSISDILEEIEIAVV